jgi:serine/threonine-protein kinase HipA
MKEHFSVREMKVGLHFGNETVPVGRLAIRDRTIYFEYLPSFMSKGIEISPRILPLKPGVFSFSYGLFEGLPGVFNDSLPDGWGRLLFDRLIRSKGISPNEITPLDRLAHVGNRGMGALVYEPDYSAGETEEAIDLDVLAEQTQQVLAGSAEEVLQELLALNGSSAGARPKAMIGVDASRQHISHGVSGLSDGYEHWLVKFPNTQDDTDAGAIEYVYALMAREAGIQVPPVHLFPANRGSGFFAVKRFDREGQKRLHVHTASGLLHADFRMPSFDYEDLITLTGVLTRDVREAEKMFRLAVFNVLAHNRDDHAKNFSFLMDETGTWKLAPAYDLTFSSGPGGEQSTMVLGEGRNPRIEHLTKLGLEAKIPVTRIREMIAQTQMALSKWRLLAKEYGVLRPTIDLIEKKLAGN